MITLEHDLLFFRFPEIHEEACCTIDFQRTLRIPDDDRAYPLPPGLGHFPLRHVDDYSRTAPKGWLKRGGVMLPMHQSEAMWINFSGDYPHAVRVATGKIDAITGNAWRKGLRAKRQNYVVVPDQPWLDGYAIEEGVIRQFVAMPLGEGYSTEEQLTGAAEHGGIQIEVFPMKAEFYERWKRENLDLIMPMASGTGASMMLASADEPDMGLAPGGRMAQEIYEDEHGLDAWETGTSSRCFVAIANSLAWSDIAGEAPPTSPPTAADYSRAGLPWFDYYGGDKTALKGAPRLKKLKSVLNIGKAKGEAPLPENEPAEPGPVLKITPDGAQIVREGDF